MNEVLIIGGDSTIGSRLVASFGADGNNALSTTCFSANVNEKCLFLDLTLDSKSWPKLPASIKTVVFCAAITSQEQCANDPEFSRRVNVEGTVAFAEQMVEAGAFVIFLSSNAVFNGNTPFAKVNDPVRPQTEYGRQKAEAEEQLLKIGNKVAIIRFSKIITPEMPLLKGWIKELKAGNVIHPFSDMVISPVPISLAFSAIQKIAEKQVPGIFQLSSYQDMTYSDLAIHLAHRLNFDEELIQPISFRDAGISNAAKNTTLDCSRLAELEILPTDAWTALDEIFGLGN
ncbi:MAG: sugar nucleotide-binding protein [Bacteroidetes bacterium]|nr:sugar nucleotide-binding protein [Bacteroidota bacterium]